MTLHPCYVRHKPQRVRFQPQNIDIYEQMPDIEKIKINAKTAIAAVISSATAIFLAGGWYFGVRQMQSDINDMKQILTKMAEHDIKADHRILILQQRVDVIERFDGIKTPRGLKQ